MQLPWASDATRTVDIGRRLSATVALIVDDVEAMRKITANQLRQMGVQRLLQASDGTDALRLLQANPVNLIISDWQMPGMDGLALLSEVRASAKGATIPFVMLTTEAPRDQILEAIRLGVSELLVKPFTAGRFTERVERSLYWRPASVQATVPAPVLPLANGAAVDDPKRLTVLVVDDTPDNLSLLSELFKDLYRVQVANTGAKAIALCQSDNPPDLVLLDVMMPGMDGFEVAQRLRQHPTSEHIPIVFVTALADDASRVRGMSLGAVDFVTKPIQPDTLRMRVANFMRFVEVHRNLQADYDQMLLARRQRDDAERAQHQALRQPLMDALEALRSAQGEGVEAARRDIGAALMGLDARTRCQALVQGTYSVSPTDLKPIPLLRSALHLVEPAFRSRGLRWDVRVAQAMDDHDVVTSGDGPLLHMSLQALLRHAADGSPDGATVQVSVWMRHTVRLEIECPALWPESFAAQFDQPVAELAGLMATPRRLIEVQQGLLALERDEARGLSRIVLTLPTERQPPPPPT